MKRIRLYAYFANNLGDDLMVDILLRKFPQYRFWLDSASSSADLFLRHPNFENHARICEKYARLNHIANILTFYKKKDFLFHHMLKKRSRNCCCSVYIGGSLFMQSENEDLNNLMRCEKRKLSNSPLFIIGANFGPYHSKEFLDAYLDFFSKCGGVAMRDQASFDLFKQLPNITYAPDVVFNLPVSKDAKTDHTVIISVIDLRRRASLKQYADAYESFIAKACAFFVDSGKTPVLMSFCESEGDPDAIRRIHSSLPPEHQKATLIYEYQHDLDSALAMFEKAGFILATRFHSMILALRMDKPFFCISYSNKITSVLEDIGCNAFCSVQDINLLRADDIVQRSAHINITAYADHAKEQFAQLTRYLTNG